MSISIAKEFKDLQRETPDRIIKMLKLLDSIRFMGVSQLYHVRQTATLAFLDNASDELILCCLLHDIGNVVSHENHGAIAANILKPYIMEAENYNIIYYHSEFQAKYFYKLLNCFDEDPRNKFRACSWYVAAERFSDDWDSRAFNPKLACKPLEDFYPLIEHFFSKFEISFRNKSIDWK